MANKSIKKLQKKKVRERKNELTRQEIRLKERKRMRTPYVQQRELKKQEKAFKRMIESMPEDKRQQLEANVSQLRQLEEEYRKEISAKSELNKELEEQGFKTPEEKIRHLQKMAIERAGAIANMEEKKIGTAGSADCSFKPNITLTSTNS